MNGRPRRTDRISKRSPRPGLASLVTCLVVALGIGVSAIAARPAFAAEIPTPPAPTRWVTDEVGFFSPDARGRIDAQLESYERSTGHQVLVWIGSTVGDDAVEDWTIRTFTAWKVGRKGIDDGLVLFVFSDDRKVRVEVGYGLEERVPDIVANRIIQDRILPKIRAGDRDAAIAEGVAGLVAAIQGSEQGRGAAGVAAGTEGRDDGTASPGRPAVEPESQPLSLGQKILYTLIAIGILIFVITHPQLAFWLLLQILSGSSGGGGGGGRGGGGGWSGGGGRGGGGGATGSW